MLCVFNLCSISQAGRRGFDPRLPLFSGQRVRSSWKVAVLHYTALRILDCHFQQIFRYPSPCNIRHRYTFWLTSRWCPIWSVGYQLRINSSQTIHERCMRSPHDLETCPSKTGLLQNRLHISSPNVVTLKRTRHPFRRE